MNLRPGYHAISGVQGQPFVRTQVETDRDREGEKEEKRDTSRRGQLPFIVF